MKKHKAKKSQIYTITINSKEVRDKQKFLQDYLQTVPFYRATYLFENYERIGSHDLTECYDLFMQCALKGNAYALFYIKHLQDYYSSDISDELKLQSESNIVIKHLDFWLDNVPILRTVDPSDYLKTSLIKMEIKQSQKNNLLSEQRKKEVIEYLKSKKDKCTAAYVLLQDIVDDKYIQFLQLTVDNKKKIKTSLDTMAYYIVDLFLLAYAEPNNIKVGEYLDAIYQHINQDDNDKYQFNGVLERIMGTSSNRNYWQTAGAFMGNGFLYYMNAVRIIENLDTRIKSCFFSALSGHLLTKAALGMYFYSLTLPNVESTIDIIPGCTKLPLDMITQTTKSVGNIFLLSFSDISYNLLKTKIMTEYIVPEKEHDWRRWGEVYCSCGKLIESLAVASRYNEKSFVCYTIAALFSHPTGTYNLASYYENNNLNSNPENKNKAISYYEKSLTFGDNLALNRLIIIHYDLENYEKAAYFLQQLFDKNIAIIQQQDQLPLIYANMLINGWGLPINKEQAYKIIINSALQGNSFSKVEIIKDFITDNLFSHNLQPNKLSEIATNIYNNFSKKQIYNEDNLIYLLIRFFASPAVVNAEIAKELIERGLNDENPMVMALMAHYHLCGNQILEIKENTNEVIKYCNNLLQNNLDLFIQHEISNLKGVALMRGVDGEQDFAAAETLLLDAYNHQVRFAAYNLGCLYLKMDRLDKSFEYLIAAYNETPDDPDVLCDFGMCLLKQINHGSDKDIDLIKQYFNRAIQQGNKRCIPDLIILHLNESFSNDRNITIVQLLASCNSFSEYISSPELMNKHSDESKCDMYLLDAIVNLISKPFLLGQVINKFKALDNPSYRLKFALQYLENNPQGRNINELGFDLYLIIISAECTSMQELEDKFVKNGLILRCEQPVQSALEKIIEEDGSYCSDDQILQRKINRFKERLAKFIHPNNSKSTVSFQELKQLCIKFSHLFPSQVQCTAIHATGGGSAEKIVIHSDVSSSLKIFYHHEHRSGRSSDELPDKKRQLHLRSYAAQLQELQETSYSNALDNHSQETLIGTHSKKVEKLKINY